MKTKRRKELVILVDGQLRPATFDEWEKWFDRVENRILGQSMMVDGVIVTTICTGLSYGKDEFGRPLVLESLVDGGPLDGHCKRYATVLEAVGGHAILVEMVRGHQQKGILARWFNLIARCLRHKAITTGDEMR